MDTLPATLPASLIPSDTLRDSADTEILSPYMPSGLQWLDKKIGGLLPGDLMVLGGRASVGKSHVSLMMAHARALAGAVTVLASLEDQAGRVAARLKHGYAHPQVLLSFPSGDSTELLELCDDAALAGASLLVIDYVQLTTWSGVASPWSRSHEIDLVMTALRKATAERGMSLMLLAQASKPYDMKHVQPFPSVYELSDAPRTLAAKPDVIVMVGVENKHVGLELTKAKDAEVGGRIVLARNQGVLSEPDGSEEDAMFGKDDDTGSW